MDENVEINDNELDEVAGGNFFGDIVGSVKSFIVGDVGDVAETTSQGFDASVSVSG